MRLPCYNSVYFVSYEVSTLYITIRLQACRGISLRHRFGVRVPLVAPTSVSENRV